MSEVQSVDMVLEYQPTIESPPIPVEQLFKMACSNDEITIKTWRKTWVENAKANHAARGPWAPTSVGKMFAQWKLKPAIIVGSGPSLKKNVELLATIKDIPIISCLHNFHFLEDHGVKVDYYVTLDAGPVTIEEVHEGGKHAPEHYWELSKERKLLSFVSANPGLLEKWKGEVHWFHCPIPDDATMEALDAIEPLHTFVSNGGNVLGACLYLARGIFAANPIIFLGADFSFSYTKKFHSWNSKYDASVGQTVRVSDVYGNRVHTWQSYLNFKAWFDRTACHDPGIYINATEGGIFGAYEQGNIKQVLQMPLKQVVDMYSRHEHLRQQCENPQLPISKENPVSLLF